ncbi:MAG: hypothetical protein ACLTI1_10605 [Clostridia bacterium]
MPKNSEQGEDQGYKNKMQKDLIKKLKEQGLRITKLILLDIILEEDCSCVGDLL